MTIKILNDFCLTKNCHHHLSVHIQNMDIAENSSTHATKRISTCLHYPPVKSPCRRTTNQLSWLPAADLVGNFPTNHPWWEVSALENWKPFTGITEFQRQRWEKQEMEKPFRLGMREVPIHWGDSRTSKPQQQQQSSCSGFSSSQRFHLTPAGNVQSSLSLPKSHNKQAESPVASDLLFTPKAALGRGTEQGKELFQRQLQDQLSSCSLK